MLGADESTWAFDGYNVSVILILNHKKNGNSVLFLNCVVLIAKPMEIVVQIDL